MKDLIQISVFIHDQVRCYLFRVCCFSSGVEKLHKNCQDTIYPENSLSYTPNLIEVLKSVRLVKVGVDARSDLLKLGRENKIDLRQASSFDLRFMACYTGFQASGLASLVDQGLHRGLSK